MPTVAGSILIVNNHRVLPVNIVRRLQLYHIAIFQIEQQKVNIFECGRTGRIFDRLEGVPMHFSEVFIKIGGAGKGIGNPIGIFIKPVCGICLIAEIGRIGGHLRNASRDQTLGYKVCAVGTQIYIIRIRGPGICYGIRRRTRPIIVGVDITVSRYDSFVGSLKIPIGRGVKQLVLYNGCIVIVAGVVNCSRLCVVADIR